MKLLEDRVENTISDAVNGILEVQALGFEFGNDAMPTKPLALGRFMCRWIKTWQMKRANAAIAAKDLALATASSADIVIIKLQFFISKVQATGQAQMAWES